MNQKSLGVMIAELRKKQGMTQLDLAKEMGVTDKAVSKWERDLSCPDINSFPHLAEILNTSVDELLQVKSSPVKESKPVSKIMDTVFKGVAAAMGIAVTVLSILGQLEVRPALIMLGIGLACLAINSFDGE